MKRGEGIVLEAIWNCSPDSGVVYGFWKRRGDKGFKSAFPNVVGLNAFLAPSTAITWSLRLLKLKPFPVTSYLPETVVCKSCRRHPGKKKLCSQLSAEETLLDILHIWPSTGLTLGYSASFFHFFLSQLNFRWYFHIFPSYKPGFSQ